MLTFRYGGECGRVGSDWCANGDDFVAGTTEASPGDKDRYNAKLLQKILTHRETWIYIEKDIDIYNVYYTLEKCQFILLSF